jgi:hypothetical protein
MNDEELVFDQQEVYPMASVLRERGNVSHTRLNNFTVFCAIVAALTVMALVFGGGQ